MPRSISDALMLEIWGDPEITTVAIVYRSNHGHVVAVAEAHAVEASDQEGKIVVRI